MRKLYFLLLIMFMAGSLSAQHGTVIPIDSTQFVDEATLNIGKSAPSYFDFGDTVTVEGVVNFDPKYYGMSSNRKATWIQGETFHPFRAVNIFIDPSPSGPGGDDYNYSGDLNDLNDDVKFYENLKPGYTVKVTGVMNTYDDNTQINLIPVESEIVDIPSQIDTAMPVKPIHLTIDNFSKNDGSGGQVKNLVDGEQYEGFFVQFNNVTVVDVSQSGDRFYWGVMDSAGNKINIRDVSAYYRNDDRHDAPWVNNYTFEVPSIGTRLSYIRGVIMEAYSSGGSGNEFRIAPLMPTDIKVAASAPFISDVSRWPIVATSSDEVKIGAEISDNDGQIVTAELYYSTGFGNKNFTRVNMDDLGGNKYSGYLPTASDQTFVNYYIKAVDDSGFVAFYPDSLATGSMYQVMDNGITKISDIQQTPFGSGASIWEGDTIPEMKIQGVVTATLEQLGYVCVQDDTQPYSGIFLTASPGDGLADYKLGDSVEITSAYILEQYGVTYFEEAGKHTTLLSSGNDVPDPVVVMYPDSVNAMVDKYAEAYEGMFIKFEDVYVVDQNADGDLSPNYGEFVIGLDTQTTDGLRVDDESNFIEGSFNLDSLSEDQYFSYIQGILYYSFSNFKLLPRDKDDIAGYNTIYVPLADFTSDKVNGEAPVTIKFMDKSSNSPYQLDYMWSFDGGTPESSTKMNPEITYSSTGDFDVKLKVTNKDGQDSITKQAYISVVGVEELENIESLMLYPNPVSSRLSITGNATSHEELTIRVLDQNGKLITTDRILANGRFSSQMDLSKLEKGIYFIQFINRQGDQVSHTLMKL